MKDISFRFSKSFSRLQNKIFYNYGFFDEPIVEIYDDYIIFKGNAVRSVPLFFIVLPDKIILTDRINKNYKVSLNNDFLDELRHFKYTLGNDTIWNNVFQLLPGQVLKVWKSGEYELFTDYVFRNENKVKKTPKELIEILYKIFESFFNRIESDKKILIPLSGGFDSRIIAFMIKEFGFENRAFAFCYGQKNAEEVNVSKNVAKRLGLDWYFIEYNEQFINDIIFSDLFNKYIDFYKAFGVTPHIQDLFSLVWLKDNGLLNSGDVVIPGHSGDFLAGSRLVYTKNINSLSSLKKAILGYHVQIFRIKKDVKIHLENRIDEIHKNFDMGYSDIFEIFDWQERQSKYIANSVRNYEFFDLNWFLPLWEKSLFDFFSSLDNSQRFHEKLYRESLNLLFTKYDIDIKTSDTGTSKSRETLKKFVSPEMIIFAKRIEAILKNKGNKHNLYGIFDFGKIENSENRYIEIVGHITELLINSLRREE
ncbi:Asparagine synthase [Marinitoga piezophila KA3]|uniref:asparagine synthase (glutamine-hydrolyzing) n=1 Tax=Marinitoga piezophila (strain DSM 14283 / JCM 11233 / KA3) TaxID=443254 RepID=H2J2X2_MARPK|nr:asparagine synthase C-terminal domain-containing protein [Marinitoga piezophila]AEX85663.1 Asparagine synthase [Marinitoga piezophila KA3]